MIPVLFTTYNRLAYTKQSLPALLNADLADVYVIDNNSSDGTYEYLKSFPKIKNLHIKLNLYNSGVSGAMNTFLDVISNSDYAYGGKIDNDTIVSKDFFKVLVHKMYDNNIDIIQAKHPILKETYPAGFDAWMKTMKQDCTDSSLYYNHFVGGSGIVFRRDKINNIPETTWKLGGWREFQRQHPELRKAFCTEVEFKLLDMNDEGGHNYEKEYENYYKETGRIK